MHQTVAVSFEGVGCCKTGGDCVCNSERKHTGGFVEIVEQVDKADAQIVEELYPVLRRFAAVVAPWDIDPDDVLHTALVNVLRGRELRTLDDPGAYLRRAIVNGVNSEIRRSRTRRLTLRRMRGSGDDLGGDVYPSDIAELMRLKPVQRAVLYLHDIEGFAFNDVAKMVGITSGNARVTASRARRRLRAIFIEEDRP